MTSVANVNNNDLYLLQALTQTTGTSSNNASLLAALQANGSTDQTTTDSSLNVSGQATLFSKLEQLQQSDPQMFKQVTAEISQQLTAAASTMSGQAAQGLTTLANEFQQASQTGTLTALQPAQQNSTTSDATGIAAYQQASQSSGTHHHHGHPAAGSDSSQMQSLWTSIYNEVNQAVSGTTAATNQNGTQTA